MKKGILYGIGVGPGDPELLTLKAVRIIRESDVLFLPAEPKEECYAYKIVEGAIKEVRDKEVLCRNFPMTKDKRELETAHEAIFRSIWELLEDGKRVAFLTLGDPTIYSTYVYIQRKVQEQGGSVETINGVTSFCAAAARLGISLGDGPEEIHIISGNQPVEMTEDYSGTRIFMKSGRRLLELKQQLEREMKTRKLSVYTVSNCGMANERIAIGLAAMPVDKNYLTIVIVKEE